MVQMIIAFNGEKLVLPVNPEKITPSRSASNTDIDLIGIGKATRKGEPGLFRFSIESFFPGSNSYFHNRFNENDPSPRDCVDFINRIWKTENINNNVPELIVIGIPIEIDMYFVIENFDYDHSAGQEDDIPFKLDIKQYRPYGVVEMTKDEAELYGNEVSRVQSPEVNTTGEDAIVSQYTYTVENGDCLYNITKACTGTSNRWGELYELNKEIIGNNPGLIFPGQVLKLPEGWQVPKKVAKLKNKSKSTNSTKTQLVTEENKKSNEEEIKERVEKDGGYDLRFYADGTYSYKAEGGAGHSF